MSLNLKFKCKKIILFYSIFLYLCALKNNHLANYAFKMCVDANVCKKFLIKTYVWNSRLHRA